MHKPFSLKDYAVATFLAVVVGALLLMYLHARRGYIDLYIGNKVFASVGLILLALVFLIGPLMRHFSWGAQFVRYRKEVGIIGGILVILHGLVSLFFLPDRFPITGYRNHLNTFIPGLIGVLTLGYLIWISRQKELMRLGGRVWWVLQRWGIRVVVVMTLLHVIFMKYAGWKKWILSGGTPDLVMPGFPPASLLATSVLVLVVVIRFIEYCGLYPHQGVSIHASEGQDQGPLGEHEPPTREHGHFSRSRVMRWVIVAGFFVLLGWYVWLFWHGSRF